MNNSVSFVQRTHEIVKFFFYISLSFKLIFHLSARIRLDFFFIYFIPAFYYQHNVTNFIFNLI